MTNTALSKSTRLFAGLVVAATIATSPVPAMAQDQTAEARLRKIEAEIRALQRNVFPGGDGRFFEPQIAPGETRPATPITSPTSTTAVTDILARLDAIELQLQRLTALTEESQNAMSGFETRIAALEAAPRSPMVDTTSEGATDTNLAAMTGATGAVTTPAQPTTGPSAERIAAVRAIAKPATDDPGDDDYSYGFRLWSAGFYPEARQALSDFIEKYPRHSRQTYARNLLGRAFLDDGQAEEAARWFLRNYNADKQAARAPDSLLFLAESMIAMKDTNRACIALAEFAETYPSVATGRLAQDYAAARRKVTCN
jgi:TolA-binding protein